MWTNQKKNIVEILPSNLRHVAGKPWVPWPWVIHRHIDLPAPILAALFQAYECVFEALDIDRMVDLLMPAEEDDGCRRCGSCCAELIPDPVTLEMVRFWDHSENPLARMYTLQNPDDEKTILTGWTFSGERLRLCPFLLRDPAQGSTFCALHTLGPGQRPEACAAFKPSYPHCAVCYRPEVIGKQGEGRRMKEKERPCCETRPLYFFIS